MPIKFPISIIKIKLICIICRHLKDYLITRGLKVSKWKETGLIKEIITTSGMKMCFGKYPQYTKVGISRKKLPPALIKSKTDFLFSTDSVLKSWRTEIRNSTRHQSRYQNIRKAESYSEKPSILSNRPQSARDKPKSRLYPLQRAKTIYLSHMATKSLNTDSNKDNIDSKNNLNGYEKSNSPLNKERRLIIHKSTLNNSENPTPRSERHGKHRNSVSKVNADTAPSNKTRTFKEKSWEQKKMCIHLKSCEDVKHTNVKLSSTNTKNISEFKSEYSYNTKDVKLKNQSVEIIDRSFFSNEREEVNCNLKLTKSGYNQQERIQQNINITKMNSSKSELTVSEQNMDNKDIKEDAYVLVKKIHYKENISEKDKLSPTNFKNVIERKSESSCNRKYVMLENQPMKVNDSSFSNEEEESNFNLISTKSGYNQPEEIKQITNITGMNSSRNHMTLDKQIVDKKNVNEDVYVPIYKTYYEENILENDGKESKSHLYEGQTLKTVVPNENHNLELAITKTCSGKQDKKIKNAKKRHYCQERIFSPQEKFKTDKLNKNLDLLPNKTVLPLQIVIAENINKNLGLLKHKFYHENQCANTLYQTTVKQKMEYIKQNQEECPLKNVISLQLDKKEIGMGDVCLPKDQITSLVQKVGSIKIYEDLRNLNNVISVEEKEESKFLDEDNSCLVGDTSESNQMRIDSLLEQGQKTQYEKANRYANSKNDNVIVDQKTENKNEISDLSKYLILQQKTNNINKDSFSLKNKIIFIGQNRESEYSTEKESAENNVDPMLKSKIETKMIIENIDGLTNHTFHKLKQMEIKNKDSKFSMDHNSQQNKEKNILVKRNNSLDYQADNGFDFDISSNEISASEHKDFKVLHRKLYSPLYLFHSVQELEIKDSCSIENEGIGTSTGFSAKDKKINYFSSEQNSFDKISANNKKLLMSFISNLKHKSRTRRNEEILLSEIATGFRRKQILQNLTSEKITEFERTRKDRKCNTHSNLNINQLKLEGKEVNSKIIDIYISNLLKQKIIKGKKGLTQMQSKFNCSSDPNSRSSPCFRTSEKVEMTEVLKEVYKAEVKKSSSFISVHSQPSSSFHSIKTSNSSNYLTGSESSFSLDYFI